MSKGARGAKQKGSVAPASAHKHAPSSASEPKIGGGDARRALKDWHAVVVLGLAIAIFFREILLGQSFFWEDWLTQVYPFRTFAAVSLAGGELPLWNPYAHSGMPFQADIQSALFYLPNLLLTLFVRDGTLSIYWIELVVIAHYWLAGVTMYYLAREFRLERPYALFAGLVFALSGFMIARAIHPSFIAHIAWLPLIVLLAHRAMLRKSPVYAIIGGLVLGHAILAGAPQISLFIFLFLGIFALFVVFATKDISKWQDRVARLSLVVLMGTVAVGLAAVQLLPTLELAPLSQRASLTFEQSQDYRLTWSQLITTIVPRFYGVSGAHEATFWASDKYGAFWEVCFYWGIAGLLATLLAIVAARKNRYVLFFLAFIVFALMLAVGDQFILHRIFYEVIPGFDKFRGMVRIMGLVTFAAALLSGFGLRAFVEMSAGNPRRVEHFLLGASVLLLGLWLLVQRGALLPAKSHAEYETILSLATHETTVALLLTLAVCAFGFLLTRGIVKPAIFIAGVLLLQYADMSIFGFEQNNGVHSIDEYYAEARTVIPRLRDESMAQPFRVTVRRDGELLWDQNQGMVDRLAVTEGYTPLALRRLVPPAPNWDAAYDLLNSGYRIFVNAQGQKGLVPARTHLPRAFVVYDARVIAGDSLIATFMRSQSFDPRRTVVLEEEPTIVPQPDSTSIAGSAVVVSMALNSLSVNVDSPRNGILVLSEIYYPGWNAYVDGEPRRVLRGDWSLRAVPFEAGAHSIELKFEPRSLRTGVIVSAITLLLCCGLLLASRVRVMAFAL